MRPASETLRVVCWGPRRAGKSSFLEAVASDRWSPSRTQQHSAPPADFYRLLEWATVPCGRNGRISFCAIPEHLRGGPLARNALATAQRILFFAPAGVSRIEDVVRSEERLHESLRVARGEEDAAVPLTWVWTNTDATDALSVPELEAVFNPGGRMSFHLPAREGQREATRVLCSWLGAPLTRAG